MVINNWLKRNINQRNLIKKGEDKVSIVQIIGFSLIGLGVLYMSFFILTKNQASGDGMAISFFIIMLGMSLAFPSLLKGYNKDISTMRIVVFMMVNVICLLLLKIGWGKEINSLKHIGLDQYWMGVIAFVFGAKATQSYFESKMAVPNKRVNTDNNNSTQNTTNANVNSQPFTKEKIIKMGIKQFSIKHLAGVVGVGRNFIDTSGTKEVCLQINVNDKKYLTVYNRPFDVDLGNGEKSYIVPNVVYVGNPKTHNGQAGSGILNVNGKNGAGTLGCFVIDNDTKKKHLLSCQHVLNHDTNYKTISSPDTIAFVNNTAKIIGKHVIGERTHEIDAALAEIIADDNFDNSNIIKIKGTRNLSTNDTNETVKVSLSGYNVNSSQIITELGLIINNEFYAEFEYSDNLKFGIEDLIVLSNKKDNTYITLSKPGYSGALVIDENKFAIGLLVGGDDNYSYAIPINKILTSFNCSILI